MSRPFTVGVVPGVSVDKWVRVWRERTPRVPITVVALPAEVTRDTAAAADAVFLRLPAPAGLRAIPLWEERPVAVAAKGHPLQAFDAVTLADLAGEELRDGWDEGTLDLVAAGHGVARMPQSVFRASGRRDLVAREITGEEPTRVALAWDPAADGPALQTFIGIVRGRTLNSSR